MRVRSWIAAGLLLPAAGHAGEATTYRYDAKGRLVTACMALSNNGERTSYAFDAADNRHSYSSFTTTMSLGVGSAVYSPDGRFELIMQGDGNLVLYGPSGALWASNTANSGGIVASFQSDGNFVLYAASGTPLWASGSAPNYCANLQVQNDGNVVIVSAANTPVWATGTSGH